MESERIYEPLFSKPDDGELPNSPRLFALVEIPARRAQRLNKMWHSMLPETHLGNLVGNHHPVSYAAVYKNKIYAVAIWSDPIAANRLANSEGCIELRRLAIPDDAPKFTATWMLGKMVKSICQKYPDIFRFISYQASDVHKGTIYKAANWQATAESSAQTWHVGESRADLQTTSAKVRWEYVVKRANTTCSGRLGGVPLTSESKPEVLSVSTVGTTPTQPPLM